MTAEHTPSTPFTDIALERRLVGSLIAMGDPKSVREVISGLPAGTFWDPDMEHLCEVLTRITPAPDARIDESTVISHLVQEEGRPLDQAAIQIADLSSGADPRKHIARGYADHLIKLSRARTLAKTLREEMQALSDSSDADTTAASVAAAVDAFVKEAADRDTDWNAFDGLESVLDWHTQAAQRGGRPEMSLGSPALDARVGGAVRGQQMVLAARPGVGKTAVALDIVRSLVNQGFGVIVFSMEMSTVQLMQRLVAAETGTLLNSLMYGKLTEAEVDDVAQIMGEAISAHWNRCLKVIDKSADTQTIRTQVDRQRILWQRDGVVPGAMVVDYAQIVPHRGGPEKSLAQKVGEVSKDLRRIAQDSDAPMFSLLLSQINRKGSDNPTIDDLKDSGALEEDADVVMILSRTMDPEDPAYSDIEYRIAKARHGETGTVTRTHQLERMRFFDRVNITPPPSADTW